MHFKTVVQAWLRRNDVKQSALAFQLKMSPQQLSRTLARGNPTLTTLHRFRQAMDVSMVMFEEPLKLCTVEAPCREESQAVNLRGCAHCLCRCPCHIRPLGPR